MSGIIEWLLNFGWVVMDETLVFLSEGVVEMLNRKILDVFGEWKGMLDLDGSLVWSEIKEVFGEDNIFWITTSQYDYSEERVQQAFKRCCGIVSRIAKESRVVLGEKQIWKEYGEWKKVIERVERWYEVDLGNMVQGMQENNLVAVDVYAICCSLSSIIERILIDGILSRFPDSNLPRVLKEVLASDQILEFLRPEQVDCIVV